MKICRAYRKNISLVKQQPFFIHDSIRKNITLSDDIADQARLAYAVEFCGLDELLAKYQDGIRPYNNRERQEHQWRAKAAADADKSAVS
jgi:ABC-type transport system involved in cytochrome bd biosynthesis fused ATPase/permease subunit